MDRVVLFGPIFGQFTCFSPLGECRRPAAAAALLDTAKFRKNAGEFEGWDQGMAGRRASSQPAPTVSAEHRAKMTTPILMLDGAPSGRVLTGYIKQAAEQLPGPNLTIRPCTSHWAFAAEPEDLANTVIAFLAT